MYITYVIKNNKNKKYTGSTENLEDRLKMHNDTDSKKAKFHRTTYKKGPWEVAFKEDFDSRKEALNFEKFLKTGSGRDWLERARRGD
jgi:putative endonuclease